MSATKQISGVVRAASTCVADAFVERAAAVAVKVETTCTPIFRGCPCVLYPVIVLHVNATATVNAVTQHHAANGNVLSAGLLSANITRTKKLAAALPGIAAVLADLRVTRKAEAAAMIAQCSFSAVNAQAIRDARCALVQTPTLQAHASLFARMHKTLFINSAVSSTIKLKLNVKAALKQIVTGVMRARCFRPVAAEMSSSPNASFAPIRTAILKKELAAAPAVAPITGFFFRYATTTLKTKSIVRSRTIENLRANIVCRARFGREPDVLVNEIQDSTPPDTGRVKEDSFTNAKTLRLEGITERDTTLVINIDGAFVSSISVGSAGLWTYTAPSLSEGIHTFSLVSFDSKRGYISNVKTFTITVDTIAPKPPTILRVVDLTDAEITIPEGSSTKTNLPLFKGFAEINAYIEVEITINGQSTNKVTQLISVGPTGSWRYSPTLLNGSYSFSFRTVDRASNKSIPKTYAFTVNTDTPNPPVVSTVADNVGPPLVIENNGLTNDPQPVFSGTADANTTLKVRRNADEPKEIVGGTSWTYTPEKLKTGVHTFYFTSTNNAGTVSAETKYKIRVDVTNPTKPQIVSVVDDTVIPPTQIKENQPAYTNKPKFEGRGQKNAKLLVSIGATEVAQILIDDERKWEYTPAEELSYGTYVFTFVVEDPVGNKSKPRTFTLVVADPSVQPIKARPVMRAGSPKDAWWTIRPTVKGTPEVKMCICPRVVASLPGPGGTVSQITKKEKIRVIREEYGDKNDKKYIWRIPVVGEGESCACEFIHLGMYTTFDKPWRVGQEREVILLLVGGDGVVYPQTTINGEYRIVKVMNRMYDIYPPTTFWRAEPQGDETVMRQFIYTDAINYLYVWEGCGDGFFLINASC